MERDKKLSMEDTWGSADYMRYIREKAYEKKQHLRGAESTERRHRDPEKEPRREKERMMERRDEETKDRRKEGSRDRRSDKERDREKRKERDRLADDNTYGDFHRENRDRRRDKEHERERDMERYQEREKEKIQDKERHNKGDQGKRKEDSDKERKREEWEKEYRGERERRHEEARGDRPGKHHREHRKDYEDKRREKEERSNERHRDRKHSEWKEDKDYKEEYKKHKEERERRNKEREHQDEKRRHDTESREYRGSRASDENVRHHRGDREHVERDKHKERRHREEEEGQRKHSERRHKEGEEPEGKHRDKRHKEGEDLQSRHKERRHRDGEQTEGKHRDRRYKEGDDIRGNHKEKRLQREEDFERDRQDRSKKSSDKSHRAENDVIETEVGNDADLPNQEYEDDFEDYEEDFEEMDESANEEENEKEPQLPKQGEEKEEISVQQKKEIEAIQRAMDEENERVGTAQSRQSTSREEEGRSKGAEKNQSRASHRGKFIDFVAAKQREVSKKVASKQKKRSTELLRLIDLDFSMTFSLLDLPPVNEYDMYIRNFGATNTKQAYVQCNEDNVDRDIQTEEIEACEKWTQHPPEHTGACGDPNLSQEARDKNESELNFDSQRLSSFLRSASQVMVVLLEEDQAERNSLRKLKTQTDTLSFSDGSLQLNTKLPFLYGRQISLLHFSQVQKHTMMSVHMPTDNPGAVHLDSCFIICVWNIWEPSRPQKVLVYESEIQSCCFSPGKAALVFAGTSVGSVVLWDLREQPSTHYHLQIGDEEWTFRQPTFSTDAVMVGSGHLSPVTSVEVVPSTVAGGLRTEGLLLASEEESSGLSFQLASLDESGVLNFWVVVELPKGNEAGSPTDLGLRPGGKVKLLHSSSQLTAERVSPREMVKTGPLQTLLLQFLPTDSNHFFIGTNKGLVNHGTSHGLKAPPKFYRFQEVDVRPVDITSIHFSPFRPHLFLVGCGDGSIRLHTVSHEEPVAEWRNGTAGAAVVSLQWAQTRPTVFCVLDAASNLHIWDLVKKDREPVVTERMNADRMTAMAVFGDSGQQNTYSGIALAHESGKIEMQYFSRTLTVSSSAEEEKLEHMMSEAF